MAVWHAHLDTATLAAGSRIMILSDHDIVRLITADQVSIESPGGQRITAVVMDRSGAHVTLGAEGHSFSMAALPLETPDGQAEPFSHEFWLVE